MISFEKKNSEIKDDSILLSRNTPCFTAKACLYWLGIGDEDALRMSAVSADCGSVCLER